jgi:hypothetical protein
VQAAEADDGASSVTQLLVVLDALQRSCAAGLPVANLHPTELQSGITHQFWCPLDRCAPARGCPAVQRADARLGLNKILIYFRDFHRTGAAPARGCAAVQRAGRRQDAAADHRANSRRSWRHRPDGAVHPVDSCIWLLRSGAWL